MSCTGYSLSEWVLVLGREAGMPIALYNTWYITGWHQSPHLCVMCVSLRKCKWRFLVINSQNCSCVCGRVKICARYIWTTYVRILVLLKARFGHKALDLSVVLIYWYIPPCPEILLNSTWYIFRLGVFLNTLVYALIPQVVPTFAARVNHSCVVRGMLILYIYLWYDWRD